MLRKGERYVTRKSPIFHGFFLAAPSGGLRPPGGALRGREGGAFAHGPKQRGAEFRAAFHQMQEHVAADREEDAVGVRHGGRQAGGAVEQRPLPEAAPPRRFF